ncbi:unnamed protein product [Acanthoscelides obtectus]|uniref:Uncharacterized protein n=1 Tax=Acanthoscelides obtectus TaxID=200917 RepID=A0A9P0P040_ACAOB|nr:unnamed protein product [Acanthoscelides obtectus]CAK1669003.1 hypothetical protein AOBTE_LOCUS26736 [Acanthoscelides obtectus]
MSLQIDELQSHHNNSETIVSTFCSLPRPVVIRPRWIFASSVRRDGRLSVSVYTVLRNYRGFILPPDINNHKRIQRSKRVTIKNKEEKTNVRLVKKLGKNLVIKKVAIRKSRLFDELAREDKDSCRNVL